MPARTTTLREDLESKDFLAGRGVVLVVQGILLVIFLIMVLAVSVKVRNASEDTLLLHEKQVRDAYAAQNDLYRLTNLLMRAKLDGTLSDETRAAVQRASDMLWVRQGNRFWT